MDKETYADYTYQQNIRNLSSKLGKMPSKACIIIFSDSESLEDGLENDVLPKTKPLTYIIQLCFESSSQCTDKKN